MAGRAAQAGSDAPPRPTETLAPPDEPPPQAEPAALPTVMLPQPSPDEVPLSDAQAACIGLDTPVCTGCHRHPATGLLLLRPSHAPPHPPAAVDTSAELLASCGL